MGTNDEQPRPVCGGKVMPRARRCDKRGAETSIQPRSRWHTVRLILFGVLGWLIVAGLVALLVWSFASAQDARVVYEWAQGEGEPFQRLIELIIQRERWHP